MDALDTELDQKTAMSLLSTLISHRFQQQLQEQDPYRQALTAHAQQQLMSGQDELAQKQRDRAAFDAIRNTPITQPTPRPQGIEVQPNVYYQGARHVADNGDTGDVQPMLAQYTPRAPSAINTLGQLAALIQGIKGVPGETAQALIANLTGIDPQERLLQRQKDLAQYQNQLAQPEKDRQYQLKDMAQAIQALKNEQAAADKNRSLDQREAQIKLNERDVSRREATTARPAIPFKQAQAIVESMAQQGATEEEMAQAMGHMGYAPSGEHYTKGGLFGFGGTSVPVPGRSLYQAGQPSALPKAPSPGAKLTPDMAKQFVDAAGGDKNRAREAAKAQGWSF